MAVISNLSMMVNDVLFKKKKQQVRTYCNIKQFDEGKIHKINAINAPNHLCF